MKISIIGGGNLGVAIAEGIIKKKYAKAEDITVTRRNVQLLDHLAEKGVNISADNVQATESADMVILAIKPKQTKEVLQQIKFAVEKKGPIVVSVVTGVLIQDMKAILGAQALVYRAMPNTAIAICESMTCLAGDETNKEASEAVSKLFSQLGSAIYIQEELMNASTILGACGIAYALRFIRAASQGGIEIGFSAKVAQLIATQTVKGAASLLLEGGRHPEYEIDKVTTPQGCTIAGLNEMEHQGFSSALIKGIITSYNKI
ncbi:MAG: pyrroline-5-carboxylate reductase [Imperialibacter sp.]|uniref:pyrroline-5-carboxylate reductase n=1 Tax=Imperialibacter sp. TaxID=2038411 RepID=UPI0032EF1603